MKEERVARLVQYVQSVGQKEKGKELYDTYREELEGVTPQEAFAVFHALLEEGKGADEILVFLDKVINVFYKSLSSYEWQSPKNDNFLQDLMLENQALEEKMEPIKAILKEKEAEDKRTRLLPLIEELHAFDAHYVKKENILFPYLEKAHERFHGLKIMWALHDEVRAQLARTIAILKDPSADQKDINVEIGSLFFDLLGVVKKERLLLFPAASEVLGTLEWYEMYRQSLDYDFPFIDKDKSAFGEPSEAFEVTGANEKITLKTDTGILDLEQVLLIFNHLPVDLTFVDENNKVRFFNKAKDRFFPRSPAIIGRDVDKCHPPASVHIVEEIVEKFREGKEDHVQFWIDMKGQKVLIQYFALRTTSGAYKGVLEVSQEIGAIQRLEGEKRLLDWEG